MIPKTLILAILVLIFGGCRENSKPTNDDSYDSTSITSNIKTEKTPQFIVNAKDTFYSLLTTFSGGDPQYFEDIQFLTGRYKLENLKYPCVEIRSIGNKKVIIYHYDQSSYNTFVYQKIKNYWLAKYFSRGDTCKYYTYQYVLPNEELLFTYSNKEATWFSDVTIVTENRETIYMPKKGFTISPDIQNIPTIKKDYDYTHETLLTENDGLVKVQTLRTRKEGVVEINIADCYSNPSKKYSLSWWILFGRTFNKKTECK